MRYGLTIDLNLTPIQLARALSEMSGDHQAEFFNALWYQDKTWKSGWPFQLQYIMDSERLTNRGRDMMAMIGEYADKL